MYLPKHIGQSGHPIPEPVIRTTAPARITKYVHKIEALIRLLKRFSFLLLVNMAIDDKVTK
jgi:hypothetical protein